MKMRKYRIEALYWGAYCIAAITYCVVALPYLPLPAKAAFFMPQTYLPAAPARTQVNFASAPYNGVCDAQGVTRVVTLSGTGNKDLAVTVNTFASGDVGKTIAVPGAGSGGSLYTGTIATFTDAQHIVLGSNAGTALSSATVDLVFGTDNNPALITFKAAFQGTTPVQLNLPGNCGTTVPGGGAGKFPFEGIADLIVAGNGAATSGIFSLSAGMLLGTQGQYQDNLHSLRTNTANAGDSCVIAKTQPAVTVSSVAPSLAPTSVFTASASGTTLTVTAVTSGTILPGAGIANLDSNVGFFSVIQPYGTGGTTGVGGTGTYALSVASTFSSQTTSTAAATFTATVDANGVMTVSAIADGTLTVGASVFTSDGNIGGTGGSTRGITTIKSQLTGSAGSTGTYQLDNSPLAAISSPVSVQLQGFIRVTLNSTAGLSTGDTLYLTGLTGRGQLPQRMNGLKWIKVVNGTQIDLFQWIFDGGYISGGTGGGDRTSLFPNGSKILMTGWVNQAYWTAPYGYPSNPHWFEYKTVASTNPGTHQICFDTPLANAYKDTWPQYNTGSQFEVDPGGPATIYVYPSTWEASIEFKDLTLHAPNGQTTAGGRTITWRDVTMVGVNCAIPTQNVTHNWINVNGPNCSIETDKIVGAWNISGTSAVRKVTVQSSSMDDINVSGLTANSWFGSPKRLNVTNSTFVCSGCSPTDASFSPGTVAYGASDQTTITNSSIGNQFGYSTPIQRADDATHPWSMAGGVITIPNAYSYNGCCNQSEIQTRGLVPGHYVLWQGSLNGRVFKVVDVTQDTVNTYVTTNEAGGFPTGTWTASGLSVFPHPAPSLVNPSGLTGADSATALNGCGTAPLYTCQNFTNTGGASGATPVNSPTLWGEMTSFTVTNNVPYTGGGALTWNLSRFNNWQVLNPATLALVSFPQLTINTKLPSSCGSCTRTFATSGAITNSQVGDVFSAPASGALFGGGHLGPNFSANTPSDSPQVTVTLRTNQHLP